MSTITMPFDGFDFFEKFKAAGFTEAQARVQVEVLRLQTEAQAATVQKALDKYDEANRKDLATKGDVQDVRLEIEKVRAEIEKVRAELKIDIEKVRGEIEKGKHDLLKWQLGIGFAIIAIMAKGFNWIGF